MKNVTTNLGEAFQGAVAEIEEAINDFPVASSISVSTEGWQNVTPVDSMDEYYFYYDIPYSSIDSSDLPIVTIAPTSLDVAANCGLCPTCESFRGYIRLYSKLVPAENILLQCFIINGNSNN